MPNLRLHSAPISLAVATVLAAFAGDMPAHAQTAPATISVRLAAQPLGSALNELARQARLQLMVAPELVEGKTAPAVSGALTVREALEHLLSGSGLVADINDSEVIVRKAGGKVSTSDTALPAVHVSAKAEASARTEFSNSYTSPKVSIGRGEQSVRETPQSVSVVTRRRLEDQNLQTLGAAMEQTTGVVAVPYGNGVIDFTARGYTLDQYQFDGLSARGGIGSYSTSSFDTAVFDRIEVLRGPAGLLQGAGEPAGTINMVRKRAHKDFAASGALSVGSWNARRGEVDVNGSLAPEGQLRGRFVAVADSRDSYLDLGYARKTVLYGTLELDITSSTTLSAGIAQQRGSSMPNFGIPNHADGRLVDLPRSTFLGSDWNVQRETTTRYFADLEHKLDNGGQVRAALSRLDRKSFQATSAFGRSFPDSTTGDMEFSQFRGHTKDRDEAADVYVSTPFSTWGLQHNLLVGASYRSSHFGSDDASIDPDIVNNIFNPVRVAEPAWPAYAEGSDIERTESAVYSQLRLKLLSHVTLVAGGRLSWWQYRQSGADEADYDVNGRFTPFGGLIVDVSPSTSLYASYAAIYKPQGDKVFGSGFVKPREGSQYEIGVKQAWLDGLLNGQAAIFRIEDKNRTVEDTVHSVGSDYFVLPLGKTRSQGLEAEISGQVNPAWDVVAGYAYTSTRYLVDPVNAGLSLSPDTPKHSLKLWSNHTLPQGVSAGLGLIYSSGIYATSDNDLRWRQAGYTVASARLGYQINRNLDLSLNANNLFDKTYYARVSGFARQSYYGEPRNVMLTLRARY